MTVIILCFDCSEDLAQVYPFFEAVKNGYVKSILKGKSMEIDTMDLRFDIIENVAFIFDALRIKNQCCKMHLLTVVDFDDSYTDESMLEL
jgi:DNA-directed RNA polymerase subunit N (RpoN/RPB10)